MKTGRRNEPDTLRRDVRERDISRFNNRKRPSMLSEFQGKRNYRDSERDGRYSYEGSSMPSSDHNCRPLSFNSSTMSAGLHSKIKPDPRSKRIYSPLTSQLNYRAQSNHYHHSSQHCRIDNSVSEAPFEDDIPMKRPRLSVDVNRRVPPNVDPPNSADSIASSVHTFGGLDTPNDIGSPAVSPPYSNFKSGSGLSAFLEDIVSDDDDSLLQEDDSSSTKPVPLLKPSHPPLNIKTESASSSSVKYCSKSKPSNDDMNVATIRVKPSKEELLQMMEKVDRDISALELQIVNLQKKQAELKEGAKPTHPSHVPVSTLSPTTPSPDITPEMDNQIREETPPTSPISFSEQQTSLKRTLAETIYSENKAKAKSAHSLLQSLNFHPLPRHGVVPLYLQPSEAPHYHDNILNHRRFRPQLVELLKRQKISRHRKELSLCQTYDSLMADWDRKVDRMESNSKKKARDLKSRELFERAFPELKARREQLERFTRVDQRGFSVLRSDAELKELMFELYNKEEAPARYRKTHAIIPPMLIDERDQRAMFHSTNGHISDVMVVHRDLKFSNIWIEEEKATFREKFMLYPKNFDMISTFLPYKSPSDCVKYYYLSKKNENFKQLVRKANLKRKKALIKPPELSLSSSSLIATPISTPTLSMMGKEKLKSDQFSATDRDQSIDRERDIKPEFGDWTDDNISNLKEGLRKYGRAWGKVYREVGGSKTATQCKMFYDDLCDNEMLGLLDALKEHSLMKNAEKLQRKNQAHKAAGDSKKKVLQQDNVPSPMSIEPNNVDSENTESASGSDSNAEESESESTITDSGPDEVINEPVKHTPVGPQSKQPRVRSGSNKKSSLSTLTSPSSITSGPSKTSEDVVDLFLTAAEALKNNISPEVALHDHSYALPPSQLVNNMELQGTSGLSLIAAAAAVVSPNLSRNVGSGKHPVISPVRAPRGRPPNKYRGGGNNSTSKLAPTLLSPAGSSANVLLTDIKTAAFRNRTRSAPTDRPKSSTMHIPRTGSTLARMSLNTSTGRSGSKGVNLTASYSKPKYDSSSSSSLKSMIALHPQQTTGNTSAFEALVNVAVAAPPVELPKSSSSTLAGHGTTGLAGRSSGPKKTTSNRGSGSTGTHSNKVVLSRNNSSESSALSNGSSVTTATAYIDVSQAINILASLAQQTPGSSVGTSHAISVFQAQPLFAQTQALSASNLLESIVSQSNPKKSNSSLYTSSSVTSTTSSLSVTSNPASVSATVDTLLSHLTSGVNRSSSSSGRSSSSPKPVGRPRKVNKTEVTSTSAKSNNTTLSVTTTSNQQTPDDLSNLKLLSSLVAVVAATPSSMITPQTQVSPHTSTPTLSIQVSEGLIPSNSSDFSETAVKSSLSFHKSLSDRTSPSTDNTDYGFYSNKNTSLSISSTDSGSLSTSVSNSTVSTLPSHSELPSPDELPRSVVRPNLSAFPSDSSSQRSLHLGTHPHSNSTSNSYEEPIILSDSDANASLLNSFPLGSTASDMTASLASIIPCYNPSVVQQSTLLLYTRARSFPISSSSETCPDEEDHLESATRGISELSKLLGRDGNGGGMEKDLSKKMNETSSDNCSESISANPTNGVPMSSLARAILTDFNTTTSDTSSPSLEHNLSSLLESRETVLNSSLSGGGSRSIVDLSPITYADSLNSDTPLNVDSQSN